jgi:hypothetical protein
MAPKKAKPSSHAPSAAKRAGVVVNANRFGSNKNPHKTRDHEDPEALRKLLSGAQSRFDQKTPNFALATASPPSPDNPVLSLREMFRAAGLGKKPVKLWLWVAATQTSAANTALAFAQRLRPSDSAEFTSLANLYDEYKAHRAQVFFHLAVSGAALTSNVDIAAAYDPVNNGAYASIIAVFPAQYRTYVNVTSGLTSSAGGAPQPVTTHGHWTHSFPFPSGGVVNPAAVNNVNTGNWTDTGVTDVDYGYWKGYVTAGGTSAITNIGLKFGIEVTFKMRS